MNYQHIFRVNSSLDNVRTFHQKSESMGAITPPPIVVRMHRAPALLKDGDQIEFTLWLGPLPVYWSACIEQSSNDSFIDRQIRGPFRTWVHRHTFRSLDQDITEIVDQVEATLRLHPFWFLIGIAMWVGLPGLFAYRANQTRRLVSR